MLPQQQEEIKQQSKQMMADFTQSMILPSLYVGDLRKDVTEATLFALFNEVGPVASIRVCRDIATHQSLGYAYINYHFFKDAVKALGSLNFCTILGQQCRVMWCQRDPLLRHTKIGTIFIKGLDSSVDNKTLYDTFTVFGNILSCKVATNEDGSSRSYAYVQYADNSGAKKAIEGANGTSISGKMIDVSYFQSHEVRQSQNCSATDYVLPFTNVYVKYIPPHCSETMCNSAFIKLVGDELKCDVEITHSKLWVQPLGVSGCFNFKTCEQAKAAVKILNGFDLTLIYPQKEDDVTVTNVSTDTTAQTNVGNAETKTDKNDNDDSKNDGATQLQHKTPKLLFACRADKRKKRDFMLARRKADKGACSLYVKHLKSDISDEMLKHMFEKFGQLESAIVKTDDNGKSRQFGFVTFKNKESALRAIHGMDKVKLPGCAKGLFVARAQSSEERTTARALARTLAASQVVTQRAAQLRTVLAMHRSGYYDQHGGPWNAYGPARRGMQRPVYPSPQQRSRYPYYPHYNYNVEYNYPASYGVRAPNARVNANASAKPPNYGQYGGHAGVNVGNFQSNNGNNNNNRNSGNGTNNYNNLDRPTQGPGGGFESDHKYESDSIGKDTMLQAIGNIRRAVIFAKREIRKVENPNDNHSKNIELVTKVLNKEHFTKQELSAISEINQVLTQSNDDELGMDLLDVLETMDLTKV